jgi:hypothetical protein
MIARYLLLTTKHKVAQRYKSEFPIRPAGCSMGVRPPNFKKKSYIFFLSETNHATISQKQKYQSKIRHTTLFELALSVRGEIGFSVSLQ